MICCSHVSCTTENVSLYKKAQCYMMSLLPVELATTKTHWPRGARETSLEKMMIFFKLKAESENLIIFC